MMVLPDATAICCRPSKTYAIGDARHTWLVRKLDSGVPVGASTAISAPPSSPTNTNALAVVRVPPHDWAGPG